MEQELCMVLVFFLRSEVMVPALIGRPRAFHVELGEHRVRILLEHGVIAQNIALSRCIQAEQRPEPLADLLVTRFDFFVAGLDVVLVIGPVAFE